MSEKNLNYGDGFLSQAEADNLKNLKTIDSKVVKDYQVFYKDYTKDEIKTIQRGIGIKNADGVIGKNTIMAILSWQKSIGIKENGLVHKSYLPKLKAKYEEKNSTQNNSKKERQNLNNDTKLNLLKNQTNDIINSQNNLINQYKEDTGLGVKWVDNVFGGQQVLRNYESTFENGKNNAKKLKTKIVEELKTNSSLNDSEKNALNTLIGKLNEVINAKFEGTNIFSMTKVSWENRGETVTSAAYGTKGLAKGTFEGVTAFFTSIFDLTIFTYKYLANGNEHRKEVNKQIAEIWELVKTVDKKMLESAIKKAIDHINSLPSEKQSEEIGRLGGLIIGFLIPMGAFTKGSKLLEKAKTKALYPTAKLSDKAMVKVLSLGLFTLNGPVESLIGVGLSKSLRGTINIIKGSSSLNVKITEIDKTVKLLEEEIKTTNNNSKKQELNKALTSLNQEKEKLIPKTKAANDEIYQIAANNDVYFNQNIRRNEEIQARKTTNFPKDDNIKIDENIENISEINLENLKKLNTNEIEKIFKNLFKKNVPENSEIIEGLKKLPKKQREEAIIKLKRAINNKKIKISILINNAEKLLNNNNISFEEYIKQILISPEKYSKSEKIEIISKLKDFYIKSKTIDNLLIEYKGNTNKLLEDLYGEKVKGPITAEKNGAALTFYIEDVDEYITAFYRHKDSTGFKTGYSNIKELEGSLNFVKGKKDLNNELSSANLTAIHESRHTTNSIIFRENSKPINRAKDEIIAYLKEGEKIENIKWLLTRKEGGYNYYDGRDIFDNSIIQKIDNKITNGQKKEEVLDELWSQHSKEVEKGIDNAGKVLEIHGKTIGLELLSITPINKWHTLIDKNLFKKEKKVPSNNNFILIENNNIQNNLDIPKKEVLIKNLKLTKEEKIRAAIEILGLKRLTLEQKKSLIETLKFNRSKNKEIFEILTRKGVFNYKQAKILINNGIAGKYEKLTNTKINGKETSKTFDFTNLTKEDFPELAKLLKENLPKSKIAKIQMEGIIKKLENGNINLKDLAFNINYIKGTDLNGNYKFLDDYLENLRKSSTKVENNIIIYGEKPIQIKNKSKNPGNEIPKVSKNNEGINNKSENKNLNIPKKDAEIILKLTEEQIKDLLTINFQKISSYKTLFGKKDYKILLLLLHPDRSDNITNFAENYSKIKTILDRYKIKIDLLDDFRRKKSKKPEKNNFGNTETKTSTNNTNKDSKTGPNEKKDGVKMEGKTQDGTPVKYEIPKVPENIKTPDELKDFIKENYSDKLKTGAKVGIILAGGHTIYGYAKDNNLEEIFFTNDLNQKLKTEEVNYLINFIPNKEYISKIINSEFISDILNPKIEEIIAILKNPELRKIGGHTYVFALQSALSMIGFGKNLGNVDGWLGEKTISALKDFQVSVAEKYSISEKNFGKFEKTTTESIINELNKLKNT